MQNKIAMYCLLKLRALPYPCVIDYFHTKEAAVHIDRVVSQHVKK